jgi:hypothetical protein
MTVAGIGPEGRHLVTSEANDQARDSSPQGGGALRR